MTPNAIVSATHVKFGNALPISLIAGPCQMESRDHAFMMAGRLKEICGRLGIGPALLLGGAAGGQVMHSLGEAVEQQVELSRPLPAPEPLHRVHRRPARQPGHRVEEREDGVDVRQAGPLGPRGGPDQAAQDRAAVQGCPGQ